jgi:hypothetical protein
MDDIKFNKGQAILQLFIHPKQTTAAILQNNKSGWWLPMLITTLLILMAAVVQHQMVNQAAQANTPIIDPMALSSDMSGKQLGGGGGGDVVVMGSGPVDGMTPEGMPAAVGESPLKFGLNLVGRLAGFWMVWLILSIILHIGLMIGGGNVPQRAIFNLAAWTSLAIAVRCVIQILFMLISGKPILGDGLSGMAAENTFMAFVLGGLDVYLVWQFVLIFIGLHQANNLSKRKLSGLIAMNGLLVLLLAALPPFVINRILAAVSSSSGFLG